MYVVVIGLVVNLVVVGGGDSGGGGDGVGEGTGVDGLAELCGGIPSEEIPTSEGVVDEPLTVLYL